MRKVFLKTVCAAAAIIAAAMPVAAADAGMAVATMAATAHAVFKNALRMIIPLCYVIADSTAN